MAIALTLKALNVQVSWIEILRRTFKDAFFKDNVLALSAQLAYYFFFALFPALLVLLGIASFFHVESLRDDMIRMLGGVAPSEVLTIISEQMAKISNGDSGGLLTFGMLTALWSSSAAMTAIVDTLNTAYDIEEGRPWWKVRLTAIGLTIGVTVFIVVSFALVMLGPTLADRIAANTPLGDTFATTWKILQWPIVFGLVATAIGLVYYFAPDADQQWVWVTPGSVFATALWLIATLGFKFYLANITSYTETYGFIGGVMVLLLWFYISGIAILIGAELNAEIEHASPWGKAPGEKVQGQRRKIGIAAMQDWMSRRARSGEKPPSADEIIKEQPGPPPRETRPERSIAPQGDRGDTARPAPAGAGGGFGDYVIGAGVVAAQVWMTITSLSGRRVRS